MTTARTSEHAAIGRGEAATMTTAPICDALRCGRSACSCKSTTGNVHCPAHDDRSPSLSVTTEAGRVLVHCYAGCSQDTVISALKARNLWPESGSFSSPQQRRYDEREQAKAEQRIVETYDYTDESGLVLYQVVRYEPKRFKQRRPDGRGGWIWKLEDTRRVLYRLPRVIDAVNAGETVYKTEGEKDVHALEAAGVTATCNPGGAGKWNTEYGTDKRNPNYGEALRGAEVVIVADRDAAGRKHAQEVREALDGIAANVRIVEAAAGKDAADHLAAGYGVEDLRPVAEQVRTRLTRFTAADLMQMAFEEPRCLIPGVLPAEGVTFLVGAPKLGKSWMVLGFAIAIASGGRALGQLLVDGGGPVLAVSLEDSPRRLRSRLNRVLGETVAPDALEFWTALPRLDEGGLDELRAWLDAHPDAKAVILDTFARVRARRSRNGSAYEDDYAAVADLQALAIEYGVAIILVHHDRKAGAEDWLDSVNGSTGLTAAADAILLLKRARGQHDAELLVTGRDLDDAEIALKFDSQIGAWAIQGDTQVLRLSRERQEILEAVEEARRPVGPKEIAEATGRSYAATRQTMTRMADDGDLRNLGRGQYVSPGHIGHKSHNGDAQQGQFVTDVTYVTEEEGGNDEAEGFEL